MRLFNLSLFISIALLSAGEFTLKINFLDLDSIKHIQIESDSALTKIVVEFESHNQKNGYLHRTAELSSLGFSENENNDVVAVYDMSNSEKTNIDSIVAFGTGSLKKKKLDRLFSSLKNETASFRTLRRSSELIKSYSFLEETGNPYYAVFGQKNIAMVLPMKETFSNTFSGFVGIQPEEGGKSQFVGDIRIHLENTFRSASMMDFWWQRKDENSQIISTQYENPLFWKLNFGIKLSYYQNLFSGLYLRQVTEYSLVNSHSKFGKWYIGGGQTKVTVTDSSEDIGLTDHNLSSFNIENIWERRNNRWNPDKGFYFQWKLELGKFETKEDSRDVLYRLTQKHEFIKSLFKKVIIASRGLGGYSDLPGDKNLPESEQFQFGGASTLRGYLEQSFISNWYYVIQNEIRQHSSQINFLYLFSDIGWYNVSIKIPLSAGFGIQQKTPIGVLRLEYAVNRDDRPGKGKIHIQLMGKF